MIKRPVFNSVREFHASVGQFFKQKTKESNKKTWTPKKASGEYRSFRRASAFANNQANAEDVTVDDVTLRILTKEDPSAMQGSMVYFPENEMASLRHLSSFRAHQNNELFKKPASLVRKETVDIAKSILDSASTGSKEHRYLIEGPLGIGKSTLLSQAHAFAKLQGWAVLHLPRTRIFLDGDGDALPMTGNDKLYAQPMLARKYLKKWLKANKDVLPASAVKIIASSGSKPENSMGSFLEELNKQNVPVLLTMDSINDLALTPYSVNRTATNELVYHGDLEVPRAFLDYVSGKKTFNQGAVIAATSGTVTKSLETESINAYSPVEEFDPRLAEEFKTVKKINLSYFTSEESNTYLQYLHKAGIAPEVTAEVREYKHAVSGNGNPREILKSCVNFSF